MNDFFRLLPEAASESASEVDALTLTLIGTGLFFSIGIALAIMFLAIRYWHTRDVNRRLHASYKAHWEIELLWSAIPLLILIVFFAWGAKMFIRMHQPLENPQEVSVVAKQWMWKIAHQSGPREINTLHLLVNQPVRLTMISEDVIHSFFVPAFRNKQDVLPGRYTTLWFEPTKPGTYYLFCAEYCGTDHAKMIGTVIVQTPEDHARWLTSHKTPSAAERGRRLVESSGCLQCHGDDGNRVAPPLSGLFGHRSVLADGSVHRVDAAYIRRAIINPQAQVRAGYPKVMPSFEGKLTPEQILDITAYLRSVADATGPAAGPGPETPPVTGREPAPDTENGTGAESDAGVEPEPGAGPEPGAETEPGPVPATGREGR